MHHLSRMPRREQGVAPASSGCQGLVRFFALLRIKPHAPPLVRAPVNSFEFHSCERTPQAGRLTRLLRHREYSPPTPSVHRLQRGLPGYLILFAPHALAPQRQLPTRLPPSQQVFLLISTHFTATPGILQSSPALQQYSITSLTTVKPPTLTNDLHHRLRALYAQSLRTTLAPSVLPRLLARS